MWHFTRGFMFKNGKFLYDICRVFKNSIFEKNRKNVRFVRVFMRINMRIKMSLFVARTRCGPRPAVALARLSP